MKHLRLSDNVLIDYRYLIFLIYNSVLSYKFSIAGRVNQPFCKYPSQTRLFNINTERLANLDCISNEIHNQGGLTRGEIRWLLKHPCYTSV